LSPYFRPFSNRQATINCSALWQTSEKVHTAKVKYTQTKQSERREIVINRNVYADMQSTYTKNAKITLYGARHEQLMNTEHRKRKLKQRHVIY